MIIMVITVIPILLQFEARLGRESGLDGWILKKQVTNLSFFSIYS